MTRKRGSTMGFLLSLALGGFNWLKGLPWQVWAGIAVIAAVGLSYCVGERNGTADERAAWETKVAEIRAERDAAMQDATEKDQALADIVAADILENRKELDDVVKDLPDQELSARQCARVAQQLRREGRGHSIPTACTAKLNSSPSE